MLEGDETRRFWDVTLPEDRRVTFPWPGLLDAPALIIPLARARPTSTATASPTRPRPAWATRPDWPVPYWLVDTAMGSMLMLLAVDDAGLGALFFGIFGNGEKLLAELGVPDGYDLIGTIAMGYRPEDDDGGPGRSAARPRRTLDEIVHRGGW